MTVAESVKIDFRGGKERLDKAGNKLHQKTSTESKHEERREHTRTSEVGTCPTPSANPRPARRTDGATPINLT